jgi:hypothetical protein
LHLPAALRKQQVEVQLRGKQGHPEGGKAVEAIALEASFALIAVGFWLIVDAATNAHYYAFYTILHFPGFS